MMKKIFLIKFVFAAILVFGFQSCDNEPLEGEFVGQNPNNGGDDGGMTGGGDSSFTVDIDGQGFTGQTVQANVNEDGLAVNAITGSQAIAFQIFNPNVGSYNLANTDQAILLYDTDLTDEESDTYLATSGTINLTSVDNTNNVVSGTFNANLMEFFGATGDVVFTNGIFENIPFSGMAPTDRATAMINGTSFNASLFPVANIDNNYSVVFDNDMGEQINLAFPGDVAPGTYPIAAMGNYSATYRLDDVNYSGSVDSGNIVITSNESGVVSGTFEFSAVNDTNPMDIVQITQGEFTIDIN